MTDKLCKECAAMLKQLLRACAQEAVPSVFQLFTDLERYPALDSDASLNYAIGYLVGVAETLDMPIADLVDVIVNDD